MLSRIKKVGLGVAALTGAAAGGAAVAGAATSHSSTAAPPRAAPGKPPPAFRNMPAPGTAVHEEHEKAVTGDAAEKGAAPARIQELSSRSRISDSADVPARRAGRASL